VDTNSDGVNDRFVDANGDGIDDQTGRPYCMGFGWVDANNDGINDAFVDTNADGVNDFTGYRYDRGYTMASGHQGYRDGAIDWPMRGSGMMM